jgi:hypothetical protein
MQYMRDSNPYSERPFVFRGADHLLRSAWPVNAVSNFLTCAEVKFPRPPISVISRQGDHELRFWEADRDGGEAVLGLAH